MAAQGAAKDPGKVDSLSEAEYDTLVQKRKFELQVTRMRLSLIGKMISDRVC